MIKIESGIAIPPRPPLPITKDMAKLKVHQSFRLPETHSRHVAYASARRLKIKVTTRKVEEEGWNGIRVWRTA